MKDVSTYTTIPYLDGVDLLHAKNHTIDFPNHTHNTFNIALVINQSFKAKLPSQILTAPVGTICVTNNDEVHATPCDKETGNTFITFYVSPEILQEINNGKHVFFKDRVIYNQNLFSSLYQLSQNNIHRSTNFESRLINSLRLLVKEYASELPFKKCETRLFQRFLAEDPFKKFSLEKTAKGFGMDKYKFLRLFKQETGLTPNNYIIVKRIEQAKDMISKQQGDLLDIAISSGFYDSAHFCREFKKYTGVTPSAYKQL